MNQMEGTSPQTTKKRLGKIMNIIPIWKGTLNKTFWEFNMLVLRLGEGCFLEGYSKWHGNNPGQRAGFWPHKSHDKNVAPSFFVPGVATWFLDQRHIKTEGYEVVMNIRVAWNWGSFDVTWKSWSNCMLPPNQNGRWRLYRDLQLNIIK